VIGGLGSVRIRTLGLDFDLPAFLDDTLANLLAVLAHRGDSLDDETLSESRNSDRHLASRKRRRRLESLTPLVSNETEESDPCRLLSDPDDRHFAVRKSRREPRDGSDQAGRFRDGRKLVRALCHEVPSYRLGSHGAGQNPQYRISHDTLLWLEGPALPGVPLTVAHRLDSRDGKPTLDKDRARPKPGIRWGLLPPSCTIRRFATLATRDGRPNRVTNRANRLPSLPLSSSSVACCTLWILGMENRFRTRIVPVLSARS